MEPFYFGRNNELFGVYHPAESHERQIGIVIAHPFGSEYIRSHRSLLHLAAQFSASGFHVLRFDFSGCGDSMDKPELATIEDWRADLETAILELMEGSGVENICLVGLRLGATICYSEGIQNNAVAGLVLWDPVAVGQEYLDEIQHSHSQWRERSFARASVNTIGETEVLGYALSPELVSTIRAIDLTLEESQLGQKVLILDTQNEKSVASLHAQLLRNGTEAEVRYKPSPPVWVKQEDEMGNIAIPRESIRSIVDWTCESLCRY